MPSSLPRLPTPFAEEEVGSWVPANPLASVRLAQERVPRVRWRRCWFDRAPQRHFPCDWRSLCAMRCRWRFRRNTREKMVMRGRLSRDSPRRWRRQPFHPWRNYSWRWRRRMRWLGPDPRCRSPDCRFRGCRFWGCRRRLRSRVLGRHTLRHDILTARRHVRRWRPRWQRWP